jgi:hypothetical protein
MNRKSISVAVATGIISALLCGGCTTTEPVTAVQTEQLKLNVPVDLLEPVEGLRTFEGLKYDEGKARLLVGFRTPVSSVDAQ